MRKRVAFAVIMVLVLSLFVTGCVQKSEHDKIVADLNAKVKAAEDAGKKTKADLDKATADLATANKKVTDLTAEVATLKGIVDKLTTEVTIYEVKDNKLAPKKVRVTVEPKVEGLMENALKELLKVGVLPKDSTLVRLAVKGDTATVTFSKEFRANWPTEVAKQKLAAGAVVQTLTEFKDVKKVMINTVTGAVRLDKGWINKALVRDDPALK